MTLDTEVLKIREELSLQNEAKFILNQLGSGTADILKKNKAILAGGAITSIFSGAPINDFDIYFPTIEDFTACNNELTTYHRRAAKCKTGNAFTFTGIANVPVQLIQKIIVSSTVEIFDAFDFTIVCGAYDFANNKFIFHQDFYKHLAQRQLIYNPAAKWPIAALIRAEKYKKRGFNFSNKEFIKVIAKIISLDLKTNEDVAEQLKGMYGMGGSQIIERLKKEKEQPFSLESFLDIINDPYTDIVDSVTSSLPF